MVTGLKIGGSVITREDAVVDHDQLDPLLATIATHDDGLVLVHGAGSFGHPLAREIGISREGPSDDLEQLHELERKVHELTGTLVKGLHRHGVRAAAFHPSSMAWRDRDGTLRFDMEPVMMAVDEGLVPVLHGTVVMHRSKGFTVLSGDEILVKIAAGHGLDPVGFCCRTAVKDSDGDIMDRLSDPTVCWETDDASGGMAGKVRTIQDHGNPADIFPPSGLDAFLDGRHPGTTVEPHEDDR